MAPPAQARSAYLTTAQFGQHLGLAPEWVRACILSGELAAIKERGRYYIPRNAVGRYLKRQAWWRGPGRDAITHYLQTGKRLPGTPRRLYHVRVWLGARRLDVWGEAPKTLYQMLKAYCPGDTPTKVEDAPLGLPSQDESDTEFQAALQKISGKRAWRRDWRSTAPARRRRRPPG